MKGQWECKPWGTFFPFLLLWIATVRKKQGAGLVHALPSIKVFTFGSLSSFYPPVQLVPCSVGSIAQTALGSTFPLCPHCLSRASSSSAWTTTDAFSWSLNHLSLCPSFYPSHTHFLKHTLHLIPSKPKIITTVSNICRALSSFQAPSHILLISFTITLRRR